MACSERGGDVYCNIDVDEILVRDGRAAGVRTDDGAVLVADEAVVVSATPDQLYGRLLRSVPGVPAGVRTQTAGYRYKRGCFQMNLALSARPRFRDPRRRVQLRTSGRARLTARTRGGRRRPRS
jgi:phytoene dehydrogenase-like protein